MEAACLMFHLQFWLLLIVRHKRSLVDFSVVENWPKSFVIIGAIWVVWKSSLGYWPCWGIIPDVFLYTAVKQEVEPKPKIDLNHCFVKNQNWTWIIVFSWLHWIQTIITPSWIQPRLKPNWTKHRLWPHFWIGETLKAESASCNGCSWCYLSANSNFVLLCMCAYAYACMYLPSVAVYTLLF